MYLPLHVVAVFNKKSTLATLKISYIKNKLNLLIFFFCHLSDKMYIN